VAALASIARTHRDASADGADRFRSRAPLRVVDGGSARPTAVGGGTAAAVDPLTSLDLDFGDVPTVVLAGEAMAQARVDVYAALIAGGAIAAIAARPDETAVAFLNRAVATIDAGAFVAHFGEQEGYAMETIADLGPQQLVVSFEAHGEGMVHCDIAAFDAALRRHDPQLAGALIRLIEHNGSALNPIGPSNAWELARLDHFYDDFECWWEETRAEVESDKRHVLGEKRSRAKITVSNLEVRKHIRESGVRTPGALRRSLGRHYCMGRRLKGAELQRRIAVLPKRPRLAALAVFEIAQRMKRANAALERLMTDTDRHALSDLADFSHPVLILDADTGGEQSALYEILDERYQRDAQDKGWGPGLALVLDAAPASARRLTRALRALRDLSSAAHDLCEAMRGFSLLATEAS
jgi:hypothetical protein